ncbi:MFS transporter [Alphaproteobacteria bacterium GH1-50]|uniref:MFS transporter n=1 Tax=Kangsaoukella pontilimi TaxID=2691042 RepID=A0A7C9IH87_9RHOB|nr:MFS transporter [Kangsaoukella pontilimi]MXQ08884.1 MFS transporter [Kangsaoukella pontilimi]
MTAAERNIALYPWFRFTQNLLFWQAVWFLYFQNSLSAAEAILLYAVYDLATTILEVPSGWMSDRLGRRITLISAAVASVVACLLLALGGTFWVFVAGQVALGAAAALTSGTDTALLYESLEEAGQTDRVEAEELRAWRFGFSGLALSAVIGGAMSLWSFAVPFLASAVAYAVMLVIALRFTEPRHHRDDLAQGGEWARFASLKAAFVNPVLIWLLGLAVLMYGFSHIPFVFGQPFIQNALQSLGLAAEAPLVSGAVVTAMMLISVLFSLVAEKVRRAIGLAGILLFALGLQIGIIAVLAASKSVLAIAVLFLRMVPDSFSTAFILARTQRELSDDSRATYMSFKSLAARILFAASLWLAAGAASDVGLMSHAQMQPILAAYAGVGLIALIALAVASRFIAIDPRSSLGPENPGG